MDHAHRNTSQSWGALRAHVQPYTPKTQGAVKKCTLSENMRGRWKSPWCLRHFLHPRAPRFRLYVCAQCTQRQCFAWQ